MWAAMEEQSAMLADLASAPVDALAWAQHMCAFAALCPGDFWGEWPNIEIPQEQRDALLKILDPEHSQGSWFAQRLAESFGVTLRPIGDYWEGHNLLEERAYLRTLEE